MNVRSLLFVALLAGSTAALANPPAKTPKPPPTRTDGTVTSYSWKSEASVKVADPYRWLEEADSPEVKTWIGAQNAYTEKVMSSFPDGEAIAKRVQALALTSTRRAAPKLVSGKLFFLQQTPPQPQPELFVQAWPKGTPKLLVNPNPTHAAITGYWPSHSSPYVVYGTAEGGNEATTLRVLDLSTGKTLPDSLPHAGGGTSPAGVVWDANGKGFSYVRMPTPGTVPASEQQFGAALYHHVLGTKGSSDALAFGKGLSKVAEYTFATSDDGANAAIFLHYGDGNPDDVYLRSVGGWRKVLGTKADVRMASEISASAVWQGGRLLVVSYRNAPRGKLLSVSPNGKVRVLVRQGAWAMNAVAALPEGFLITRVAGPDWRVMQYDLNGKRVRTVRLPRRGIGIRGIASSGHSPEAIIAYSGWKIPSRWVRFDSKKGTLKTVFEVKSKADYSKIRSRRLTAISKDGTKIPVTVLFEAGTKRDGKRPAILYGYGGFDIVISPHFVGPYLTWLDHGGIWALANIRGGGAYGEGFHEAGMLGKKQNDFDDFYAAAQALIAHHWTDRAHLGIQGASNGGLLMGASLTQHPHEYRAVVSSVGIYDMLRSELWPNGAYNVSEYGTVKNRKDFDWLYAYSPLHHVKKDTAYPAVLLITAVNDARVAPWQSRKFAAALQAATSSSRPILLLTRMNEGHGVTASFSQRVGNTAAALTFFANELGLSFTR